MQAMLNRDDTEIDDAGRKSLGQITKESVESSTVAGMVM